MAAQDQEWSIGVWGWEPGWSRGWHFRAVCIVLQALPPPGRGLTRAGVGARASSGVNQVNGIRPLCKGVRRKIRAPVPGLGESRCPGSASRGLTSHPPRRRVGKGQKGVARACLKRRFRGPVVLWQAGFGLAGAPFPAATVWIGFLPGGMWER